MALVISKVNKTGTFEIGARWMFKEQMKNLKNLPVTKIIIGIIFGYIQTLDISKYNSNI